jgi:hypothetical protein
MNLAGTAMTRRQQPALTLFAIGPRIGARLSAMEEIQGSYQGVALAMPEVSKSNAPSEAEHRQSTSPEPRNDLEFRCCVRRNC